MLEQSCNSVNGESFFITDGRPTDINFFLDPLYSMFAQDQSKTFPKNQISTPFIFIYIFSLFFALMSHIFGKCFKLPYWAFTPMETYKVVSPYKTQCLTITYLSKQFIYSWLLHTIFPSKKHKLFWIISPKYLEMRIGNQ